MLEAQRNFVLQALAKQPPDRQVVAEIELGAEVFIFVAKYRQNNIAADTRLREPVAAPSVRLQAQHRSDTHLSCPRRALNAGLFRGPAAERRLVKTGDRTEGVLPAPGPVPSRSDNVTLRAV